MIDPKNLSFNIAISLSPYLEQLNTQHTSILDPQDSAADLKPKHKIFRFQQRPALKEPCQHSNMNNQRMYIGESIFQKKVKILAWTGDLIE